jgi:hypothetical protein
MDTNTDMGNCPHKWANMGVGTVILILTLIHTRIIYFYFIYSYYYLNICISIFKKHNTIKLLHNFNKKNYLYHNANTIWRYVHKDKNFSKIINYFVYNILQSILKFLKFFNGK